MCELLSDFEVATSILSGCSYPSMAHVRIVFLGLKAHLEEERGIDYQLKDVIRAIQTKLSTYWTHLEDISYMATFLDPRFKRICFPNLTTEEILRPIRERLYSEDPTSNATTSHPHNLDIFIRRLRPTYSLSNSFDDEITRYYDCPDASENTLPLVWWNAHKEEYPRLAKMARDYLAIMATSVPCENLFSIAGATITKKRNRLSTDSVRAFLCLKSWLEQSIGE